MLDATHPLLLGSSSPRRRQILETLGIPVRQAAAEVDERRLAAESVDAYLARVTREKLAAAAALDVARDAPGVLVADTAVVSSGRILGKPHDDADAASMLAELSGKWHEVMTRFAIGVGASLAVPAWEQTVVARVEIKPLAHDEIAAYVATGEGRDKAGSYAVQGIGAFAVRRIDGSYGCVVGLPACEVVVALRRTGLLAGFPLAPARP